MSGSSRRWLAACVLACPGLLATTNGASAIGLQQVGTYSVPVYVTSDPADANRLFVVELAGRIMLTKEGQTTTFLDLSALVPPLEGDRGLMSMAFAPDYSTSGRFYVFYAGDAGRTHIDEFTATGDSADPGTRQSVLEIDHPSLFHYGGQLQFGPDGYLYISTGDNGFGGPGPGGDPLGSGQDINSLHSKILRIDPTPGGGYAVPADNPFVGEVGSDEIWSYGLRNPWRFSFDRSTGDLVIADVGQDAWEEIDFGPQSAGGGRGENYGWNCREGPAAYSGCLGDFTEPAFAYPHYGVYCSASITGGYVVRDPALPQLLGRYVYSDFCKGEIRSLNLALPSANDDRLEVSWFGSPTSFGEDASGRIYLTDIEGTVYRLAEGQPAIVAVTQKVKRCKKKRRANKAPAQPKRCKKKRLRR